MVFKIQIKSAWRYSKNYAPNVLNLLYPCRYRYRTNCTNTVAIKGRQFWDELVRYIYKYDEYAVMQCLLKKINFQINFCYSTKKSMLTASFIFYCLKLCIKGRTRYKNFSSCIFFLHLKCSLCYKHKKIRQANTTFLFASALPD